MVATIGNIYPVPAYPYNILPFIFLGLLLAGVAWIAYVYKIQPKVIEDIREDALAISARFSG